MTLLLLALGCTPSADEPASIAWDRIACDECGMMLSDPRYAAQLTTAAGDRLVFDDPACAFHYVAEHAPHIRHLWFADSNEAGRWIDWQGVAFVTAAGAPMNGGLAAVPVGTDEALSFSEASSRVLGGG